MTISASQLQAFRAWRQSQPADWRWCIIINADPDALASAVALKRLLHKWARGIDIMRINEVTRPDNLAMIRYLRIPAKFWQPEKAALYDAFAMVDSQPAHNPAFGELLFNLIIDHHPLTEIGPYLAEADAYCDIQPEFGATSSMMAQMLRGLRERPGALLATALLYGIRTDTATFERSGGEQDLKAYQWLSQYADNNLLRRISRSEYLRSWLPYFSRAFRNLVDCSGGGAYAQLNEIKSADLLVAVADFFTKVHGLKWIAVSGIVEQTVIVVFRGDGSRDIGRFADACFHDVGSAGGHRNMGRAEFPLSAVPRGLKPSEFIYIRLMTRKVRPKAVSQKPGAEQGGESGAG
ncbi:MAG: phosphoesterase [Desulfovibrio sp.]|nr:phosphoesterase [Desulfovibrio sp.]